MLRVLLSRPDLTPDAIRKPKVDTRSLATTGCLTPTNRFDLEVSITANSTTREVERKPRPDFPLFPHETGRWAKKVRGKLNYFGKTTDDPKGEAALLKWLDEKDDLLAGRKPRAKTGGLTVGELMASPNASHVLPLQIGEPVDEIIERWPGRGNGIRGQQFARQGERR